MGTSTLTLPVNVQQIAIVIRQMSRVERRELLNLVPDLGKEATKQRTRTLEEAQASVDAIDAELMAALNNQPISGDTPFLAGLTFNRYVALPDKEQGRIWDEAAEIDWDDKARLLNGVGLFC